MASGNDEKQAGSAHAYPVSLDSSLLSESNFEGGWELEPVAWDLGGGSSSTLIVNDDSGRSGAEAEHNLVPHGVIGAEYLALKKSGTVSSKSMLATPQRDPYHGKCVDPRSSREPGRESFNLMVVGEAGLGKTTLLESFFKSFRDEDATSALFERKETQKVIETRRLLEDAGTRRDAVEREMRAAAETGKYVTARKRQAEINSLAREATRLAEELKVLRAADERRRVELHTLRESARSLRMEMKRAADSFDFQLASEKQVEARAVQAECETLQAALREMRRDPTTGKTGGDDEEESSAASKSGLTSATVRVSPFDPFGITVGKNELTVTLIDTPGYGDNLNTVESFEVITAHVEGLFKAQLIAETSATTRDYDRLRNEDPLVHCCLYFIAPHRLKHIDVAFMRRLHQWVNIVPIIAKSDTMTTKEKEEFKLQVRETLAREGIEPYAFDPASVRSMEQQDRQEYKPPWAVIGSTDAHLDAGVNVYLRKYPWGDALSSEPSHSDLPALRNLIMWSGQWQELKQSSRVKYEQWRVSRSVASRSSFAVSNLATAAGVGLGRQVNRAKRAGVATCSAAGLAPRTALRLLGLLVLILAPLPAVAAYRWAVLVDPSASRQAELMRGLVDQMAAEKGAAVQAYEKRIAALSGQLKAAQAAGETTAVMERSVHKEREALARSLQAAKDRISTLQSEAVRAASEKAASEEKAAAALAAARAAASAAHGGRCWNAVASDNMRSLLDSTAKASSTLFDAANDAAKEVSSMVGKDLPMATKRAAAAASRLFADIKHGAYVGDFKMQPVG